MKPNSLMVSFYGWPEADKFVSAWKEVGLKPKSHLVFVKNNIGLGWFTRGQHEVAYLLAKGNPIKPERAISDVLTWEGTGNELHPTQKPLGAIGKVVAAFTKEGDVVFDPFAGSGTTCLAAINLNRKFIGIEIDPEYCKIARERLKQPILI